MKIDKACYERGCACYDSRIDTDAVEVSNKCISWKEFFQPLLLWFWAVFWGVLTWMALIGLAWILLKVFL